MSKSSLLLLLGGMSLLVMSVCGYLLWNFSKTGRILSFNSELSKGRIIIEGPKKVAVNQSFNLNVDIDSNNQNINAMGIFIRFDPEKIQVNEIDTLNSFCQFYPEKKFDNRMGIISLSCGAPHPGVKGLNKLIQIKLTPLSVGTSSIRVSNDSKMLLSDGKGTNILGNYPVWEVQIGAGL